MLATMTCPLLGELTERLAALGADLEAELMAANQTILEETIWTIEGLYPAGTAYSWQMAIGTMPDAVASVEIKTDDPILYWYEYGTKPHEEEGAPGGALAFEGTNEFAGEFQTVQRVDHPGESAHPNAGAVMLAMQTVAREEWTAAIQELLFSVV